MEDFYRPSLIGRGGPIVPTTIPGTDFALKNHMVQLLRLNCQFYGFTEMVFKFLPKYYPYSRALQLRKDILKFRQLPSESVFQAWENFKSCLRKCPDHRILLVDQIQTFYYGIIMIDRDKLWWLLVAISYSLIMIRRKISFFLETLLEDEPLEAKNLEIDSLIRESKNTFLIGDTKTKFNPYEDIDDLVSIPLVAEKPLDSLDCISKTFKMTRTDPLFNFVSEFTLNLNNPIFGIHNEESDESETETIMDEVQSHSP
nr:hypothetical protein [Tanacetum cinerariifolium]